MFRVNFYLNDTLIGTVESGNSFFDLSYNFLFTGYHTLKLEVITKSGTGSIADSLGMEGILFATREWVIAVRNTLYTNVTTTVSEGFLKLRWPEPLENVPFYIVYRYNTEIGRVSACEYIDKGYVGEGAEYYVRYYSPVTGELMTYGWVEIFNEMEIRYTSDENNHYAVEWEKPTYYAAVDTIVVLSSDGYYSPFQVQKTADINQTSFEIPQSYFGQERQYLLGLIPKYSNPAYNVNHNPWPRFFSPSIECIIGYPSPIFEHFNRISSTAFIYHTDRYDLGSTVYNDSIFRYSAVDNTIVERYRYNPPGYTWSGDHYWNPTSSPDGNHYMAVAGFTGTAVYSSTRNFNDFKIVDIGNLTSFVSKIPVSNVGTGIVYGNEIKYLYDFENEKVLGSIDNSIALSDYDISPDGMYLFLRVSHTLWLYTYQNDTLTFEKEIRADTWPGFDYFDYMGDDPGKVVSWDMDSKEFSILTCPGFEQINSFKVNEDQILDIDYYTDRILSWSPGKLVVTNLLDGTLLYEIAVSFRSSPMSGCYLHGNSIFYQKGARYFLN